ncbi:MAG TPA: VOC family protein [Planctomycetaceae bacterium]|nr:VOC family protein [Planctomycetaceae bacterium]
MSSTLMDQMTLLADRIKSDRAVADSELTMFSSGSAMLDVRRRDGRAFVMAFAPELGFAVDELHTDDGFIASYQFTSPDFAAAARRLCELVIGEGCVFQVPAGPELNLVVVYSKNLEAARDFYASLGLSFQSEQHGTGPQHYAATLGAAVFEIYPSRNGERNGELRIGFQVESVDGVVQRLRERQITILSEPRDSAWGRRAVVEDPDGNRVELTQRSVSVAS